MFSGINDVIKFHFTRGEHKTYFFSRFYTLVKVTCCNVNDDNDLLGIVLFYSVCHTDKELHNKKMC